MTRNDTICSVITQACSDAMKARDAMPLRSRESAINKIVFADLERAIFSLCEAYKLAIANNCVYTNFTEELCERVVNFQRHMSAFEMIDDAILDPGKQSESQRKFAANYKKLWHGPAN